MAIIPLAGALGGYLVWYKVDADNKVKQENDAKEWKAYEPRLKHTYEKYKVHEGKGEIAKAIRSLKEYISLMRQRGSVAPADETLLDRMLEGLTYKAQAKGLALSREFKSQEESLRDDPYALSGAHYEYIEKLKVVLPQDDAFLRKAVEHWERLNPEMSLWD
ncbi:hypothetical protein AZH11_05510 [Pseudomonas simiae]|nr:hypothetical protein AZH11_05510 [Pseudomonas simiae]